MGALLVEEGVRVEIDENHQKMLKELVGEYGEEAVKKDLSEIVQRSIYESKYGDR